MRPYIFAVIVIIPDLRRSQKLNRNWLVRVASERPWNRQVNRSTPLKKKKRGYVLHATTSIVR